MSTRSYYLHQAQVCGSLARGTDDPKLKQRYEDLAVEFMQRGSRESDDEIDFLPPAASSRSRTAATPAHTDKPCLTDRSTVVAPRPRRPDH